MRSQQPRLHARTHTPTQTLPNRRPSPPAPHRPATPAPPRSLIYSYLMLRCHNSLSASLAWHSFAPRRSRGGNRKPAAGLLVGFHVLTAGTGACVQACVRAHPHGRAMFHLLVEKPSSIKCRRKRTKQTFLYSGRRQTVHSLPVPSQAPSRTLYLHSAFYLRY